MDKKNEKSSIIVAPLERTIITPSALRNVRTVQNFLLIWLDPYIGEINNGDAMNTIIKLREVINTVHTFADVDKCVDFMTEIKEEKAFMIVSEAFGQTTVPVVHDMRQLITIYILCQNRARIGQWAKEWPKIKGVFTDITTICDGLRRAALRADECVISVSFVKSNGVASKENLDQLDQSFMYSQILKEILLTIDFEQKHINEFLTYCRKQFVGNTHELRNIDKLEREYRHHTPTWWYTYPCFLHYMLNRALRTMEVDLIIKMGFFVRDLYQHIAALHSEQYGGQHHSDSFTVYRGQGLSWIDFDQLKNTQGGLMSFNNFLSTSADPAISLAFAESNQYQPDLIGVLFHIIVNPSASSTSFARIHHVSAYQAEEEILFSMHSVFRVGQIKQIDENNRLWQVELTLTGDNDPQLHALTQYIREETLPHQKGWYRLANLLIKLGQFAKAQQVCEIMLGQSSEEVEKANIYYMLGMIKHDQGEYVEAIKFHEKAFEIKQKILPPNHPALATSYDSIGGVYYSIGEYQKALSFLEKALKIKQESLPPDHPNLAVLYSNIGLLYHNTGEYSKALFFLERNIEIYQKTLPLNHPNLAISYNNIALVYDNLGEYSKALSFHEKALEIRQKTLPQNHPDLATTYNNIGLVFDKLDDCLQALSYHEKALEIYHKTLPPNHPYLAASYNNIGEVYSKMKDYSKALLSYERALDIQQRSLPSNHPDIRTVKENIEIVKRKL